MKKRNEFTIMELTVAQIITITRGVHAENEIL